ncbi:cytochrome P450 [Streptomyces sp. NBC_00878]|uniref:cytochrome P450 n=1 Tax=Streptomyces sp. NBC_00878 TaxID=2975854 RepID=UPI002252E75D|nr:cytochrome P450 [Streptomyces sp. NBC_00878]MCX4904526.1 cytochrome P450 [Streptomyces sp. NBC_00878]
MTYTASGVTLPPFDLKGWTAEQVADPYPIFRRYREASPVHRGAAGAAGPETFYVFGHDEVAAVLSSQAYGRSARVANEGRARPPELVPSGHVALRTMVENWLVFLDPPRHTELRSVLNREFSPNVVSRLRGRIAALATTLLDTVAESREFDLVESFSAPLPILVISELLGVPAEHWDWLRSQAVALQEASSSRAAVRKDAHQVADAAARELGAYFAELATRRRTEPGDDLVSLLVTSEAGAGSLTEEEIVSTCVHLMTAGHETTTNVLSKSLLALAVRPVSLARLRAAGQIPATAVEELVRFDSPVQSVSRWAYRDERLAGHDIPRGSKIVAMLGAANRDPGRFDDPDALVLDRPLGRNVGFGLGIHYCLGATLARAEIEIGLGALLRSLGDFAVTGVDYPDDMVFHGPSRLTLRRS